MPLPVLLASILLLGWPAAQLVSAILRRSDAARLKELSHALRCDPAYGDDEQKAVAGFVRDAHGDVLFVLVPVFMPFAIILMSLAELFTGRSPTVDGKRISVFEAKSMAADIERMQRDATKALYGLNPSSPLWNDERFRELRDLSDSLAFWRWPITTALTGLAITLSAPFLVAGYGMRWSIGAVFFWVRRLASFARVLPPFRHA